MNRDQTSGLEDIHFFHKLSFSHCLHLESYQSRRLNWENSLSMDASCIVYSGGAQGALAKLAFQKGSFRTQLHYKPVEKERKF
ncbi:unnamed protein product [Linum tenue]|uniref:Uncharacterized protein n=1 Tax=Linum tenue TaxID=586396 RepID=A0AAV0GZ00_9ROSI|nr:unnamed protein product [Linum tenue]